MKEDRSSEEVELWLDRGSRRYLPGDVITGHCHFESWRAEGLQAIELTLLWYTAGQGEEDFCVHHFQRHEIDELDADSKDFQYEAILPASPYSYDGEIVKVCWTVRLKGFFKQGRPRVVEAPFWLTANEQPNEPAPRGGA